MVVVRVCVVVETRLIASLHELNENNFCCELKFTKTIFVAN